MARHALGIPNCERTRREYLAIKLSCHRSGRHTQKSRAVMLSLGDLIEARDVVCPVLKGSGAQ